MNQLGFSPFHISADTAVIVSVRDFYCLGYAQRFWRAILRAEVASEQPRWEEKPFCAVKAHVRDKKVSVEAAGNDTAKMIPPCSGFRTSVSAHSHCHVIRLIRLFRLEFVRCSCLASLHARLTGVRFSKVYISCIFE
jgi:hypothetical protein